MSNKTGSLFNWLVIVIVVIAILIYVPYFAERIGYKKTSGEVSAYENVLASMKKGEHSRMQARFLHTRMFWLR